MLNLVHINSIENYLQHKPWNCEEFKKLHSRIRSDYNRMCDHLQDIFDKLKQTSKNKAEFSKGCRQFSFYFVFFEADQEQQSIKDLLRVWVWVLF